MYELVKGESHRVPEFRDPSVSPGIGPMTTPYDIPAEDIPKEYIEGMGSFLISAGVRGLAIAAGVPAVLPGASALLYWSMGELGIPRGRKEQARTLMHAFRLNPDVARYTPFSWYYLVVGSDRHLPTEFRDYD